MSLLSAIGAALSAASSAATAVAAANKNKNKNKNKSKPSGDSSSSSSNSPSYGNDDRGDYKIKDDGSRVYRDASNSQYFPDNYGGSAGWRYTLNNSGSSNTSPSNVFKGTHEYKVDDKGGIYKNGRYLDLTGSQLNALNQDPYGQQALARAREVKSGIGATPAAATLASNPSPYPEYLQGLIPEQPVLELPEVPEFVPYEMEEFDYEPPNYSFTSKASNTNFVPTLAKIQQWNNQEQAKANQTVDNYNASISQHGAGLKNVEALRNIFESDRDFGFEVGKFDQTQQLDLADLNAKLSDMYGQGLTPATNVNDLLSQVAGLSTMEQKNVDWETAGTPNSLDYQELINQQDIDKYRQQKGIDLDTYGQQSAIDSTYSSSETDNKYYDTAVKESRSANYSTILATAELYASGKDFYADITRDDYAPKLIEVMGADNYNKLLQHAIKLAGDDVWQGSQFKPGQNSPVGMALKAAKEVNFNSPTSSRGGSAGITNEVRAVVDKYAKQYNVDPALILAIGQHETGWGKLGDGKNGMYLGYGSYDSGSDYSYAGLEKQVKGVASKLAKWGATPGNVSLDLLKIGNSGKLPSGIYATDKKWPEKVWKYYQQFK